MIRPVYRVQCDGPGKEWLSLPDGYVPGTDLPADALVAADTAEKAGNWPGEREAKRAAIGAGWRHPMDSSDFKDWLCPACQTSVSAQTDAATSG
jgi:hypothetical protein